MAPLHPPGVDPGNNALTALANIARWDYPVALLAADRAYTNCTPDDFQSPARAFGYQLVLDYKIDQLGIQDSFAGPKLIDGTWYCPAIPDRLADATREYRRVEGHLQRVAQHRRGHERHGQGRRTRRPR
jgi:hypothetical protein